MPSNRATSDSQAMGMRKSGSSNMEVSGMAGQGANPSASSSMLYALTHSGMQGRDKFVQGGAPGGAQGGTPIRGASGSTRRKIVAQQSHQHFKKHLGAAGPGNPAAASSTFRDGTPKERHGHQIPQIGLGSASNRVKSSRQSERASASNGAGQGQPRAITPKQAQKMYSSINVQKNTRGSPQSKLNLGNDPANYLTQNTGSTSGGQYS